MAPILRYRVTERVILNPNRSKTNAILDEINNISSQAKTLTKSQPKHFNEVICQSQQHHLTQFQTNLIKDKLDQNRP